MRRTTGSLTLAVLVLAQVVVLAPQSPAAGVMEFACVGHYPVWPSSSVNTSGVSCNGTGRYVDGSTRCVPDCAFSANIDRYQDDCLGPGLSPTGWFRISGLPGSTGAYRAERSGFEVVYYLDGTSIPVGKGEWLPLPPWPTCGASAQVTFQLTGRIAVL